MNGAPSGGNELEMGCVRYSADAGQGGASGLSRDPQADYVVAPSRIAATANIHCGRENAANSSAILPQKPIIWHFMPKKSGLVVQIEENLGIQA